MYGEENDRAGGSNGAAHALKGRTGVALDIDLDEVRGQNAA